MRMTCYLFCVKFDAKYRKKEDNGEEDNTIEGKPMWFKFLFYLFCCFLCPSLVLGQQLKPVNPEAGEGGEDGEEGEGDDENEDGDDGEGEDGGAAPED